MKWAKSSSNFRTGRTEKMVKNVHIIMAEKKFSEKQQEIHILCF